MPLSEAEAQIRKEELAACTRGHEAVKDDYLMGAQKWKGRRIKREKLCRSKVRIWILLFLTRQPEDVL